MAGTLLSKNARMVLAAVLMMVVGSALFLILPIYVGALVKSLGLTDELAGYLVFSELTGAAILSIGSFFLIQKVNWRNFAVLSLIGFCVLNLASLTIHDYTLLLLVRFATGVAAGAVIILSFACLSASQNVERGFAIGIAAEVFFQVLVMLGMPAVIEDFGVNSVFLLVVFLSVIILPTVYLWVPEHIERSEQSAVPRDGGKGKDTPVLAPLSGLSGTFAYFVFIGAFWGYIERVGDDAGLSSTSIGDYLAIGLLIGLLGAIMAAYIGGRIGTLKPIALGVIVQVAAVIAILIGVNHTTYLVAVVLFSFGWNFILPFQMAAVSNVDLAGRFVVTILAFQAFGEAVGAALGGEISEYAGYSLMMWVALVFLVCSLFFYLVIPKLMNSWQNSFQDEAAELTSN